jgi:hypothetical protein
MTTMTTAALPGDINAMGDAAGAGADDVDFAVWLQQLRALAAEQDALWLIAADGSTHRPAFARGLAPEQELNEMLLMGEWRGCGCGGG